MENVLSTYIFIENGCGAFYEMEFPKGADMKPPRDCCIPLEVPSLQLDINKLYEELKWYGDHE